MKILYCSAGLNGLDSLLFDGVEIETGLPSQTKVLKGLIDAGYEVHIINGAVESDLNIQAEWLKKAKIASIVPFPKRFSDDRSLRNVITRLRFPGQVRNALLNELRDELFDFVYLHGEAVAFAAKIIRKYGIPCGQRAYGSSIGSVAKEGTTRWLWTRIRRPWPFEILQLPKDFVLATKDGSEVGEIAKRVCGCNLPYDLYEWDNGVDFPTDGELRAWDDLTSKEEYVFCGARIEPWKRQDFAIDVLRHIDSAGERSVKLIFAGGIFDKQYYEKLKRMIASYGLEDRVYFLGMVPRTQIPKLHRHALATFFTYEGFSRGNSFLEAMAAGSIPVVLKQDHSVKDLITDGLTGFAVQDAEDAARRIIDLTRKPQVQSSIRIESRKIAKNKLPTWDARVQKEIELIEKYTKTHS